MSLQISDIRAKDSTQKDFTKTHVVKSLTVKIKLLK